MLLLWGQDYRTILQFFTKLFLIFFSKVSKRRTEKYLLIDNWTMVSLFFNQNIFFGCEKGKKMNDAFMISVHKRKITNCCARFSTIILYYFSFLKLRLTMEKADRLFKYEMQINRAKISHNISVSYLCFIIIHPMLYHMQNSLT